MSARLLTAADLAVFPTDLPSGTVDYELDDGRLVIMTPTGYSHGATQSNVVTQLKNQGEFRNLGKACTEVGVVLQRSPDRVRGPDVMFICQKSLPIRRSAEGYLETIPDLVVEVRSKNDTDTEIARKVEEYLRAGVSLIWILDPEARTIVIHRPNGPTETLGDSQELTAGELIPGFSVSVAALFAE